MINKKNILIVDDHPLFREGLKTIINRNANFEVTCEAGNAQDGIMMVQKNHPDIAIVDLSLPDKSGIQLTSDILTNDPAIKVIIVSMHSKIDYIAEAFQAGASGYLIKDSASEKLLEGLEAITNNESYLDSHISMEVLKKLKSMPVNKVSVQKNPYGSLTSREQQVMRLLAEGLTTKDVAKKLYISPKTVENHRSNIMKKLNLQSSIELIRYAAKLGLIDVELWKE